MAVGHENTVIPKSRSYEGFGSWLGVYKTFEASAEGKQKPTASWDQPVDLYWSENTEVVFAAIGSIETNAWLYLNIL